MKLALIHDHLTQSGGAERVLEAFQAIWPDAPTYTLIYNKNAMGGQFANKEIRTSFLQKLPFAQSKSRWYLPLMPTATELYNLSEFDVILSNSSAFSKGIIPGTNTLHITYCHTPTRYLWSDTHNYREEINAPGIAKKLLPPLLTALRLWDAQAANRVDHFLANSETVKHRIERYYKRTSTVIHPPVNVDEFSISPKQKKYFLIGGRLVAYKRYDLVIRAFTKLGLPLKIYGTGPIESQLQKMAGPNIQFLGKVTNQERTELFANALAFLHPQEEDFGITPLESMAAGRPVIAYAKGGALETVIEGKTGMFFRKQTWEEVADTVLQFNEANFNPKDIRAHAEKFGTERFHKEVFTFVQNTWEQHKKTVLGK